MSSPDSPESASDPAESVLSGTPYRALRLLGRGGMGEVFEAEHLTLGKTVVVKLLQPQLADDPALADRFRFEAQALANMSHPNLIAVTDLGRTPAGRPYFVMERLAGRTLGDELRARLFLPVGEALALLQGVLAGLGAAHRHGLVHRDVKLDNIFLCDPDHRGTPRVKLLDFGIAKAGRAPLSPLPVRAPAVPTAEGVSVGTPRYIAPEQIRGGPIDGRADLYAAAIVLYTLVAGRGPFPQLSGLPLLQAHLTQAPPPPSTVAPQPIPPSLDAILLRALAKDPNDRFASVELFAAALASLPASEIGPRTPRGTANDNAAQERPASSNHAPFQVDGPPLPERLAVGSRPVQPARWWSLEWGDTIGSRSFWIVLVVSALGLWLLSWTLLRAMGWA